MKIYPVSALLICLLHFGCSTDGTTDSGDKNIDSLECIIPEPPTSFDTIVLTKMTDELVKTLAGDLKIFEVMTVERTGHEFYSNEWWYFDEKGKPKYFKGEWGSESLLGKYFYSFDTLGINLGYENTNNHEASDEIIRFCKKMTPYTGYRTYAEVVFTNSQPEPNTKREVVNMTEEDLRKKTKEILSFLESSKKSMSGNVTFTENSDGTIQFKSETPDSYETGRLPEVEVITLNKALFRQLIK